MPNIPILLYHHVAPDRDITPNGFEAQMRSLLEKGYRSISMSELAVVLRGERSAPPQAFVLTFDDGYLDNWLYVFPILQKLQLKACMYVVTDYVEDQIPRQKAAHADTRRQERAPGGFLSWQEARAMVASGWVEIGSHTQSHRHFVRKEKYENIEAELQQSKALIEKQLGRACDHLAWPWGDYENAWLPLLKKSGYITAVTTLNGANAMGSNPLTLKRIKVSRESVSWLSARLRWQDRALPAALHGFFYGWDRRFKNWVQKESPYAHG